MTEEDEAVVLLLNEYYRAKEFEYRVTGSKTYPTTDYLIGLLDGILPSTKITCAKASGVA